jgi:glutamate-1-semialdehyde 2,1-aminomutase
MTHDHYHITKAETLLAEEKSRFISSHPVSMQMAAQTRAHFLYGVPLHWMNDWGTPSPLFVQQAQGAHFTCVDGHEYTDFCLGDTGAMFGHSPQPVSKAICEQSSRGLTAMLPSFLAPKVGQTLAHYFNLPYWQLATTATDANRFVLRWVRAITKKSKLLVFDGCYHGTVDDTMVDVVDGTTVSRSSLLGQVHDLGLHTVAVPFNDIKAVERELAKGDIACVLTEPALTNCGMVLPHPGFIEALRKLTQQYQSLLVLDETHTISTAYGGWAKQNHVSPDFLVVGKPIAGGLPAAAYGFSEAMAKSMKQAKDHAPPGHSGIGTTLSGNIMTLASIQATLTQVATPEAYEHMLSLAAYLEKALIALLNSYQLPWNISRMGARLELQFCATPPHDAKEAREAQHDLLENAIHLYLLNRGVLLTPFHNMMLICPQTTTDDLTKLLKTLDACLNALKN